MEYITYFSPGELIETNVAKTLKDEPVKGFVVITYVMIYHHTCYISKGKYPNTVYIYPPDESRAPKYFYNILVVNEDREQLHNSGHWSPNQKVTEDQIINRCKMVGVEI